MPELWLDLQVGDVVRLRKPHPCGNTDWEVVRVGADIGLRCTKCGRRVILPRDKFRRRAKAYVRRAASGETPRPEGEHA